MPKPVWIAPGALALILAAMFAGWVDGQMGWSEAGWTLTPTAPRNADTRDAPVRRTAEPVRTAPPVRTAARGDPSSTVQ